MRPESIWTARASPSVLDCKTVRQRYVTSTLGAGKSSEEAVDLLPTTALPTRQRSRSTHFGRPFSYKIGQNACCFRRQAGFRFWMLPTPCLPDYTPLPVGQGLSGPSYQGNRVLIRNGTIPSPLGHIDCSKSRETPSRKANLAALLSDKRPGKTRSGGNAPPLPLTITLFDALYGQHVKARLPCPSYPEPFFRCAAHAQCLKSWG